MRNKRLLARAPGDVTCSRTRRSASLQILLRSGVRREGQASACPCAGLRARIPTIVLRAPPDLGYDSDMKRLFMLLAIGTLALSGCRVSDVRDMTVKVPGMTSEADAQRIRSALSPLGGINREHTTFDIAGRTIRVRYDSMVIAHKNIEIAIAEAGYDANAIKAITKDLSK